MERAVLPNEAAAPPIYRLFMLEVERRRRQLGVSMERLSEIAGVADRAYSKYLHSGSAHGRTARWETIQIIADTLWPDGLDIEIMARKGPKLTAIGMRHQIAHIAANHDRPAQRDLMRELSKKAAAARQKIPAEERSAIASRASRARWHRPQLEEVDPKTMQPRATPAGR
jgi:transcriptional regulator with XRE-family HTH domain